MATPVVAARQERARDEHADDGQQDHADRDHRHSEPFVPVGVLVELVESAVARQPVLERRQRVPVVHFRRPDGLLLVTQSSRQPLGCHLQTQFTREPHAREKQ